MSPKVANALWPVAEPRLRRAQQLADLAGGAGIPRWRRSLFVLAYGLDQVRLALQAAAFVAVEFGSYGDDGRVGAARADPLIAFFAFGPV